MFCECIGNDVVGTRMLWEDLVRFVGPSDMMVFEVDVA